VFLTKTKLLEQLFMKLSNPNALAPGWYEEVAEAASEFADATDRLGAAMLEE
jgi:hypothetical protein